MVDTVIIAASLSGLTSLETIIFALPVPCRASVVVVIDTTGHPAIAVAQYSRPGLRSVVAADWDVLEPGNIYFAPHDWHLWLTPRGLRLRKGALVKGRRPSADVAFRSAARTNGPRLVGIVLSGGDGDGARGLAALKRAGGIAMVQSPDEADQPSMPHSAIAATNLDAVLRVADIARRVRDYCS